MAKPNTSAASAAASSTSSSTCGATPRPSVAGSARNCRRRTGSGFTCPDGVAHGFLTLEDNTEVLYPVSAAYEPTGRARHPLERSRVRHRVADSPPMRMSDKDARWDDFSPRTPMTSPPGRVLVTGASGCVGRATVAAARGRRDGMSTPQADRRCRRRTARRWHQCDLLDPAAPRALVAAVAPTHLLHLAWYIGPGRWASAPENLAWVRASLALFEAAADAGCRRIVGSGSCLEYDWSFGYCSESRTPLVPHTLYGSCKLAVGNLLAVVRAGPATSARRGRASSFCTVRTSTRIGSCRA